MLMQDNDQLLAKDARSKFNEQAAESLDRHREALDDSRKSADTAVQDLKQRRKYRRKRADAMRSKNAA